MLPAARCKHDFSLGTHSDGLSVRLGKRIFWSILFPELTWQGRLCSRAPLPARPACSTGEASRGLAAAPEQAADQRLAIRNEPVEQQLQQTHRRHSTPRKNPAAFSRLVPEQDQSRSHCPPEGICVGVCTYGNRIELTGYQKVRGNPASGVRASNPSAC